MSNVISRVGEELDVVELDAALIDAAQVLRALVDAEAYVGEVYSLSYKEALVQIHDFHRQQVGGIPALSFVTDTRLSGTGAIDVREEDSSVVLLRVIDQADLPNAQEALRVRVETAQRVTSRPRGASPST